MFRCEGLLTRLLLGILVLCTCLGSTATAQDRLDILTEGFEVGWLPAGWSTIHDGTSFQWARTSQFKRSGNYSAWIRGSSSQTQDEWLVTRALDFSTLIDPKLEFYELSANWANAGTHSIMASTTSPSNPAAFTTLLEMTPGNHTPAGFQGAPVIVDLSSLAGEPTVYLAFRYEGTATAEHWFIDDIRLFELLARDIMTVSVAPDGDNFDGGEFVEPTVTFLNNGLETESFTATLEVYETGTLIYTEVVPVNDVPSDTMVDVDFPSFVVAAGQIYDLQATASLDGDLNPNNDTKWSYATTWTNAHVPMCILFTNAGCGPCVAVNQSMDEYIPTQGDDVALMRVHVWWPGADIMYNHNTVQVQTLTGWYGVDGVPNFFLDGFIDLGNPGGGAPPQIEARKAFKKPMALDLAWNPETEELTVELDVNEPLLPAHDGMALKLRTVITEDGIEYQGSNGEPVHNQAFRRMFPTTDGIDFTLQNGTQQWVVDCPLHPIYVYRNLRATVYIQEGNTGEIHQAGTAFLADIEGVVAVEDEVARAPRLDGNFPNPFNPSTTIKFSLPGERFVELAVYALDGTRVATLVSETRTAGEHQVVWNGLDASGQKVASGTYVYRIKAGDFSETRTMTMVK